MGLFDQVMGAMGNAEGSGQLGAILNTVQQLSSQQGLDGRSTQAVMTTVGGHVRSALQEQRSAGGPQQVASLVQQFAGTQANPAALSALFSDEQQQRMIQELAQKTGLDASAIEGILPVAVPMVLKVLQTGSTGSEEGGANSLLTTFLDTDKDGDMDLGDAMSMAGRFFNRG